MFPIDKRPASLTALLTAFGRAYHATHDSPKIFDDFLADDLFTEQERRFFGHSLADTLKFFDPDLAAQCPDEASALAQVMRIQSAPISLSRARFAEDSLQEAVREGVRQYVILGAGMDTFAFRNPGMLQQLAVFEVDHPETQAEKRRRIAAAGWEVPPQLCFVPADFVRDSLADAISRFPYNPSELTFFSWLGVVYYLDRDAVFSTLRAIAGIAPAGSTLVFDYMDADAFEPGKSSVQTQRGQEIVRRAGEPMKSGFDPSTLAADLAGVGLRPEDNLDPEEIERRYFADRTDGYHAFKNVWFAKAKVK